MPVQNTWFFSFSLSSSFSFLAIPFQLNAFAGDFSLGRGARLNFPAKMKGGEIERKEKKRKTKRDLKSLL